MVVVFLFNLMCAIVSCDPFYQPPTPRPNIESTENNFLREYRAGRNVDLDFANSSLPLNWKPDPVVKSNNGVVEGYFMKVVSGRDIYAFEGIPYAEPPLGDRRFRPPVPKRGWRGTRQAKKPGHPCTQLHQLKLNRVVGHEDCLTVNVYSPMIPIEDYNPKMPVVIFIHGGSFYYGSGSEYGPALLLQKDIVLVTINYRLGPLGFLSTGDDENPGNWGLKDQALAIQWVSQNIDKFGGDASNITLMGQSAGATSVHLQMMSNHSKDLFHKAISMSGSGFVNWAVHTPWQARKWADKLARFVGCGSSSTAKMMNCFRKKDPNFLTGNLWNLYTHLNLNLLEKFHTLSPKDVIGFPPVLLRPAIEPDVEGAFLTLSPKEAYEQNQVSKVPFLATNTREEAEFIRIILKGLGFYRLWLRHWEVLAPTMLDYRRITDNTTVITKAIQDFYFKGEDILNVSGKELTRVGTDRFFNIGNRQTLKYHSAIAPTYSYIFGLKNPRGFAHLFGLSPKEYGVSHSEDLGFVFNSSLYWESFDGKDGGMEVSDLIINLFSNFITKGEPLYTGDDGKDMKIWDPVTDPKNPVFLQIDKEVKMISDPVKLEMEFWDKLNLNESYAYEYA